MTSQPNHAARCNTPQVTLTEHGLAIDATTTIMAAYSTLAISGSLALAALFASGPDMRCSIERPAKRRSATDSASNAHTGDKVRLESLVPSAVAAAATAAGYETGCRLVWADRIGATFANRPRLIEAMDVGTGFTYERAAPAHLGTGAIVSRGDVPQGSYLVFSVGLGVPTVQAVARVEQIPTTEALAAIDGFAADRITAACGRCHRQWTARDGRPIFDPADPDGIEWDLGQAANLGFITGTVDCPVPDCPGRVGFTAAGGQA
ncbi:hypothetical protein [Glycomyces tenuis]|uniref:hypothetical protein n=1 Tax=Glycomyces tenuis TaxID=58116 RepID=UPI0012DE1CC9|nr:hypothetical protein [Glycomyces tenuis]